MISNSDTIGAPSIPKGLAKPMGYISKMGWKDHVLMDRDSWEFSEVVERRDEEG